MAWPLVPKEQKVSSLETELGIENAALIFTQFFRNL